MDLGGFRIEKFEAYGVHKAQGTTLGFIFSSIRQSAAKSTLGVSTSGSKTSNPGTKSLDTVSNSSVVLPAMRMTELWGSSGLNPHSCPMLLASSMWTVVFCPRKRSATNASLSGWRSKVTRRRSTLKGLCAKAFASNAVLSPRPLNKSSTGPWPIKAAHQIVRPNRVVRPAPPSDGTGILSHNTAEVSSSSTWFSLHTCAAQSCKATCHAEASTAAAVEMEAKSTSFSIVLGDKNPWK